jgi:hypothetical protein
MALPGFNVKVFSDSMLLTRFVQTNPDISDITAIVTDTSGRYVLFYIIGGAQGLD